MADVADRKRMGTRWWGLVGVGAIFVIFLFVVMRSTQASPVSFDGQIRVFGIMDTPTYTPTYTRTPPNTFTPLPPAATPTCRPQLIMQGPESQQLGKSVHAVGTSKSKYGFAAVANKPIQQAAYLAPDSSFQLYLDDGTFETMLGYGNYTNDTEAAALWLNRFTPSSPLQLPISIDAISIYWPDQGNPIANSTFITETTRLLVYFDTDGDGDPANAVRVSRNDVFVTVGVTGTFVTYNLSPSVVITQTGDIYAGFEDYWAEGGDYQPRLYSAALDQTASQVRSWVLGMGSRAAPDIDNLSNNNIRIQPDSLGLPGNWSIRISGDDGRSPHCPPTFTPTPLPNCGVIVSGANTNCVSPSTYYDTFTFDTFCTRGTGTYGWYYIIFEVATSSGGPWTEISARQVANTWWPSGVSNQSHAFTETNIPPQYIVYRIRLHGQYIRYGGPMPIDGQTVATSLCSPPPTATNTPTPTPALTGHLTWQGISQPHPRNVGLTGTLTLCTASVPHTYTATTDASGFFTVTTGLPDGMYQWWFKGTRWLAASGALTISNGRANPELGTQRAGDANNSNTADSQDYVILKNTYGKPPGDPTYDPRGDFNNDGFCNVVDFNLEKLNFGLAGAAPICSGGP